MESLYNISIMTLQGISTSIFDIFFFFSIMIGYMIVTRFSLVNVYVKDLMKNPKDMIIELIVQGVVIGVVLSLGVVVLGFPIVYTEYLYFILPLSYLLGFQHTKYNNVIYSGAVLSVLSLILNGQKIGTFQVPVLDFNMSGMLTIIGLLLIIESILIYLLRKEAMVPIIAKKDEKLILGFAFQRFWPIPVVLLVVAEALGVGDTVPMPLWWPLLTSESLEVAGHVMYMLPLLFVLSHGTMSFTKSPQKLMTDQSMIHFGSGLALLVVGFILPKNESLDMVGVILFLIVTFGVDRFISWSEDRGEAIFPLDHKGIHIMHIIKDGPCNELGLLPGDVIVEGCGQTLMNRLHFDALIKSCKEPMNIIIQRPGQEKFKMILPLEALKMESVGLVFVPEQPSKIFSYERIKNMGMLNFYK